MKNEIFLVYDRNSPVATFQIRSRDKALLFQKLGTKPSCAGKGIGSFCLEEIERLGRQRDCTELICDVYDRSSYAIEFYERKGFGVYGTEATLKYSEVKMSKKL